MHSVIIPYLTVLRCNRSPTLNTLSLLATVFCSAGARRRLILSTLLLLLSAGATGDTSTANTETLTGTYTALAIQGDLSGATGLFRQEHFRTDPSRKELTEQFSKRFLAPPSDSPGNGQTSFAEEITQTYEKYWRHALMKPADEAVGLAELRARLSIILGEYGPAVPANREVFDALHHALTAEHIHFVETTDPPMRDLLMWRSELRRDFTVQLTDRRLRLAVHFMDDFILQGWKDFASLGLARTTGWVEDGQLYCVAWAYDPESEHFRVSYLTHEARHLLDLEHYPAMDSTELEYRAKLTELAYANLTLKRILDDFTAKAAQNPDSPHAMANWRVIRDLHWKLYGKEMPESFEGWAPLNPAKVNRTARQLLELNTRDHDRATGISR